jgi:hypothetical protein
MRSALRACRRPTILPPISRFVPSSRAKVTSADGRILAAFGKRQDLIGLEGKVPAPVADPLRFTNLRPKRRRRIEQVRKRAHLLAGPRDPDTISLPLARCGETGSSSWPSASISTSRSALRSTACGLRSTMSITSVSGSWRETRASLTHDSSSNCSRSADEIDRGHGLVALRQRALVDLEFVEVLDPAHIDAAHLETRIGSDRRDMLPRPWSAPRPSRPRSRRARPPHQGSWP